jgi:hypothetical protein
MEDKYGKGKNCHIYSVGHAVGHPFSDGGWGNTKDGNGKFTRKMQVQGGRT